MLSLGGVDLVVDSPGHEATSFIERFISQQTRNFWSRPTWPGNGLKDISFSWPRPEAKFRLNRLVWPQGASRWAYGHFLASSDQTAAIMKLAYNDKGTYLGVPLVIETREIAKQVGVTDDSGNAIKVDSMYLLPPTPLSGIRGLTGNTQSLYLLSIVDKRWFWHSIPISIDFVAAYITWSQLYTFVARQLNLVEAPAPFPPAGPSQTPLSPSGFRHDDVSSLYLRPSASMFLVENQPVPFVLDAIAFNVGHRIIVGYDGIVEARSANTEYQNIIDDFQNHAQSWMVVAGGSRLANPL